MGFQGRPFQSELTFHQRALCYKKRYVQGAVLLNQDNPSTVVSKKAEEYVRQIGYPVFKNTIRNYVAFKEAYAAGLSVYEYDQNSKAAEDFQKFFNELKKEIN